MKKRNLKDIRKYEKYSTNDLLRNLNLKFHRCTRIKDSENELLIEDSDGSVKVGKLVFDYWMYRTKNVFLEYTIEKKDGNYEGWYSNKNIVFLTVVDGHNNIAYMIDIKYLRDSGFDIPENSKYYSRKRNNKTKVYSYGLEIPLDFLVNNGYIIGVYVLKKEL